MNAPSLKKNIGMNLILTAAGYAVSLVVFLYASRVLGSGGIGRVFFAQSLAAYFNIMAQLGIPLYGIRATAEVRDDRKRLSRLTCEVMLLNLIMAALAMALYFLTVTCLPRFERDRQLYLIMGLSVIFEAIGAEWLFKGLEKYTYITMRSLAFKLVALVFMFMTVTGSESYLCFAWVLILSAPASYLVNLLNLKKHVSYVRPSRLDIKPHFKAALVFFGMSCATTVYTNLDTLMLGLLGSEADVGFYQVAVKIKTVLCTIIASAFSVILPRISYLKEQGDKKKERELQKKALRLVALITIPVCSLLMLYAKNLVMLLFGTGYADSVLPMQIITPAIFFIGMTNVMGILILIPKGSEKSVLLSVIAGAAVDFVLNLILIPAFSSAGAAAGTLAAEITVFIIQLSILIREKRHYNC